MVGHVRKTNAKQDIAKSGAEEILMSFFAKSELWHFYGYSVLKIPFFGNTKPLGVIV
jgi:hypothetical protein